jgi:short-subunit dehydrogenase
MAGLTGRRRTALVTGAAAGLGSKFAESLARRGFDLVLVDRQSQRIEALAAELVQNFGIKAYPITQDLCEPAAAVNLCSACDILGLSVDILVNNAGLSLNKPLHQIPWPTIRDNMHLLLGVVVEMCHRFLPPMIERGWGRIINVSSVSGFMPGGMRLAIYNASKAFLIPFSEGIGLELVGTGVQVTSLCPGFMKTEIFKSSGIADVADSVPPFMWSDPKQVAEEAIRAVMNNVPVRVSGVFNRLTVVASKFMPRALLRERTRFLHSTAHRSRPSGEPLADARIERKSAALITGASAGIGASFSELLAHHGFDVILVARRGEVLERRAQALSSRYGVRTHTIIQDLTDPLAAANIAAECERLGWTIEILVNNAGYPVTGIFHRMSWGEVNASLSILVTSVVELTYRFAKNMLERGSGKIINIASIAAFQPGTYRSSLYTASKAFIVGFSESVAADLMGTGVTVTAVCPGFTKTEWFGKINHGSDAIPKSFLMESNDVAKAGLEAAQRGAVVVVTATPLLKVLYILFRIAPRRMVAGALSKARKRMDI